MLESGNADKGQAAKLPEVRLPEAKLPEAKQPFPVHLLGQVYEELRALADGTLRRYGGGATLRPTELVHEAWIRLSTDEGRVWNDRQHFVATSALAMRQIIVERARRRSATKRGGGRSAVEFEPSELPDRETPSGWANDPETTLAIDRAIDDLTRVDERSAQVIILRFYLGLTDPEIAEVLGVTDRTVRRDWTFARSWLARHLADISPDVLID